MELAGKSAIVTGAAGGIGAAVAHRLLDAGVSVTLSDLDAERLDAQVAHLSEYAESSAVQGVSADAANENDLAKLIKAAERAHGAVDIFIANAGVGDGDGLEATETQWDLSLNVNLMAHVRAARLLVPGWLERGSGYFVSTASAAGLITQLGSATYSATKHAAVGFAEWLAVTYSGRGIGVSCLCPMGVETAMLRSGMQSDRDGGRLAAAAVASAGEILDPLTVADVVIAGIEEGRFLLLPHAEVHKLLTYKVADHDRWIDGMSRYADRLVEGR